MPLRHAFRKGDVVWAEFPFGDMPGGKDRPVVVLSTDAYHDEWNEILVGAITSQAPRRPRATDCFFQDWAQAGLSKPSWWRSRLFTMHFRRIRTKVGVISTADLTAVEVCLRLAMGL